VHTRWFPGSLTNISANGYSRMLGGGRSKHQTEYNSYVRKFLQANDKFNALTILHRIKSIYLRWMGYSGRVQTKQNNWGKVLLISANIWRYPQTFFIAVLTSLLLLNVVAKFPAISRAVIVYWMDWLGNLQSHMCPLSAVMRQSNLMLAPCFFKFLN